MEHIQSPSSHLSYLPPQTLALLMSNPIGWFCLCLSGPLCVWLLSPNEMAAKLIHVVVGASVTDRCRVYSVVDELHFIHSVVYRHLSAVGLVL